MLPKLLKKELRLCLHPTTFIMLALTTLILIPNYPYAVSFFYVTLALFFICMSARENHDVTFTLTLPVAKKDVVSGRILLAVLIELLSLLLAGGMILLHNALVHTPNGAGMDANLALLAEGFLCYGVFHLIFFPLHYCDVSRIGVPFLLGSAAIFVLIVADIVLSYAMSFWRDVLDTPDPEHLGTKLIVLAVGLLFYVLATASAIRTSKKRFLRQDVR